MIYLLAIAVVLGSLTFYGAAFFHPEVHRKSDFVWSGVGLFYGLVLWFTADRATGTVLLGETASVTLLGWLGWQTWSLRQARSAEAARHATTPVSFNAARQAASSPSVPAAPPATASASGVAPEPSNPEPSRPPKAVVRPQLRRPRVYWDLDYEFVEDRSLELSLPQAFAPEPESALLDQLEPEVPEDEHLEHPAESIPIEPIDRNPTETDASVTPSGLEATADQADTPPIVDAEAELPEVDTPPQPASLAAEEAAVVTPAPQPLPNPEPPSPVLAKVSPGSPPPDAEPPIPSTPAIAPRPAEKSGSSWLTKAVIIKDWAIEVIGSLTKPKPTQPMIELPPRPRSIPRPEAVKPVQSEGEIAPDLDDWDDDGED